MSKSDIEIRDEIQFSVPENEVHLSFTTDEIAEAFCDWLDSVGFDKFIESL